MKRILFTVITLVMLLSLLATGCSGPKSEYQYKDTEKLVTLVRDAAALVEQNGDQAFPELRTEGSQWRQGENYIFIHDTEGNMLVHPDPALEGKNQLHLEDPNGKPIIKMFINETNGYEGKTEGWFHYVWPKPGDIFPTWKTTYVKQATAPSGKHYVVASGVYNMSMERAFVEDEVEDAANLIQNQGTDAFDTLRDPAGDFIFQDTYVFVVAQDGTALVHPTFSRYLEGKNIMDLKDSDGKYLIRAMFDLLETQDSGWVDYTWPKPGETNPSKKSTFVTKAKLGDSWVLVACGVYLD